MGEVGGRLRDLFKKNKKSPSFTVQLFRNCEIVKLNKFAWERSVPLGVKSRCQVVPWKRDGVFSPVAKKKKKKKGLSLICRFVWFHIYRKYPSDGTALTQPSTSPPSHVRHAKETTKEKKQTKKKDGKHIAGLFHLSVFCFFSPTEILS